jgi:hypothetical protein
LGAALPTDAEDRRDAAAGIRFTRYTVTALGTLGGPNSEAWGITVAGGRIPRPGLIRTILLPIAPGYPDYRRSDELTARLVQRQGVPMGRTGRILACATRRRIESDAATERARNARAIGGGQHHWTAGQSATSFTLNAM